MQTDNKADKPLYKVLNEKIESHRFRIASTPHEERNKGVIFKVLVREHEHFTKEYTALAVDNLESIADALKSLLQYVKEDDYNRRAIQEAKEALSKIS